MFTCRSKSASQTENMAVDFLQILTPSASCMLCRHWKLLKKHWWASWNLPWKFHEQSLRFFLHPSKRTNNTRPKKTQPFPTRRQTIKLVGGFNPPAKYYSNWITSPSRENKKHLCCPEATSASTRLINIFFRNASASNVDPRLAHAFLNVGCLERQTENVGNARKSTWNWCIESLCCNMCSKIDLAKFVWNSKLGILHRHDKLSRNHTFTTLSNSSGKKSLVKLDKILHQDF